MLGRGGGGIACSLSLTAGRGICSLRCSRHCHAALHSLPRHPLLVPLLCRATSLPSSSPSPVCCVSEWLLVALRRSTVIWLHSMRIGSAWNSPRKEGRTQ